MDVVVGANVVVEVGVVVVVVVVLVVVVGGVVLVVVVVVAAVAGAGVLPVAWLPPPWPLQQM